MDTETETEQELKSDVSAPTESPEKSWDNGESPGESIIRTTARNAEDASSVIKLATGLAHDLNNFLCIIMGNAELAISEISEVMPEQTLTLESLKIIQETGRQVALLTRRLQALSRAESGRIEIFDLNNLIEGIKGNLERLVPENIDMEFRLEAGKLLASAGPGQVRQAVIGIVSNAAAAMPDGGELLIKTSGSKHQFPHDSGKKADVTTRCILLTVRDNGCGMSRNILERIFEPFFSTRSSDSGTGLGMSVVKRIVSGFGGEIEIESAEGKGTEVRIYFPAASSEQPAEIPAAGRDAGILDGNGKIVLLCDDDEGIRIFTSRILVAAGYTVLEAETGKQAIAVAAYNGWKIDLLITDIVMPEMDGHSLDRELTGKIENLKTLYLSGYSQNVLSHYGFEAASASLVHKPFTKVELLTCISRILE